MPLYDYKCRACSKVTEVRHGFREPYDAACPACGGELARVFNPAGIVFKGSGFYLTDSRKAAEASKSSKSSKSGSSGSSSPSDSSSGSPGGSGESSSTASTPAATPSTGGDSGSKKSESSAA